MKITQANLVTKTNFDITVSNIDSKITANKSKSKSTENKSKELKKNSEKSILSTFSIFFLQFSIWLKWWFSSLFTISTSA